MLNDLITSLLFVESLRPFSILLRFPENESLSGGRAYNVRAALPVWSLF